MKTVIIIPARYKSTRFPGKPLTLLLGKPMIHWVASNCSKVVGKENVYVATESEAIASVVKENGYKVVMTSEDAITGTDRVAEASKQIEADVYVNVQGDEPMLNASDIHKIILEKENNFDYVINGYCELLPNENPANINIPKVIFNERKDLIYMSRLAIPGVKSNNMDGLQHFKQVCIYAFSKSELKEYEDFGRKSCIESWEDIEILRFLEWGQKIKMVECEQGSLAVDIPEDVSGVENGLRKINNLL